MQVKAFRTPVTSKDHADVGQLSVFAESTINLVALDIVHHAVCACVDVVHAQKCIDFLHHFGKAFFVRREPHSMLVGFGAVEHVQLRILWLLASGRMHMSRAVVHLAVSGETVRASSSMLDNLSSH